MTENHARIEEARAELALLGAALLDGRAVGALDGVAEADYSRAAHQILHRAILLLAERHPDLVRPRLRLDRARLDTIVAELGGDSAVTMQAALGIPQVQNCEHYAAIVRRGGALRRARECARAFAHAYDSGLSDTAEIEALATSLANESGGAQGVADWTSGLELARLVVDESERASARRGRIPGASTGFEALDSITNGYQAGQLWVLGGRPSDGKSAWALCSALHVASEEQKPVAFVSLEMSRLEVGQRAVSILGSLNAYRIRRGLLEASEYPKLARGAGQLGDSALAVIEGTSMTVDEIRARVRRLHWQRPVGLVVVDYLQLVRPSTKKNNNRENDVSEISRGLKTLSMQLGVPVLALSQLNREVENRKERRPRMSDLRESGSLEQDADCVLLLWKKKPEDDEVTMLVEKCRGGSQGHAEMSWQAQTTTFRGKVA